MSVKPPFPENAEPAAPLSVQQRAEFIAILGHELRNPIAAIQNAVQLAQGADGHKHLQWSLKVINRQSRQVSRLLEDLLDISRASQGMMHLHKEETDLNQIIQHVADAVQTMVEGRQHELLLALPPKPLPLFADSSRLEQVLVNLVGNAVKYTEPGGRIIIRAWQEGSKLLAEVEDNGMGIPPEAMSHIFDMFTHASDERAQGGLGIGLPIAKRIVELHGGSITPRSDGPGKGTVFRLELPPGEASAPAAPQARALHGANRSARVLIIDDNADSATGMNKLLRARKHEVEVAHDGTTGLELAQGFEPELILLDLGLPDISGYDLVPKLRAEDCCARTVIVAITGFATDVDQARAKATGFDHFLVKPVDMEMVFHLVDALER